MALKKFVYPLDLTGTRASNRVEENHTLGTQEYRAFALKNGPFYTKDLTIRERNSGKLLKRGDDYECVFFYEDLSALTPGMEICGVIVVHNTAVSEDVVVTANIAGGPFAHSAQVISDAIDALEINNKNTYWKNVIDKPDLFQPTPHFHDFADIYGMEFLIDVLGHIRDTLLIGGNAQFEQVRARLDALENALRQTIQAHLEDYTNPHKVTAEQVNCYDKERIDQFIQALNVALGDLEPRFRSIINSISDVNLRIDGLVQAMNNNDTQLQANEQSLSRVHLHIADVNTAIDLIRDNIVTINNEILGLKQRDEELTDLIDKNIADISKEKTRNDTQDGQIQNLISKDTEHDTELSRQNDVDVAQGQEINAAKQRLGDVESKNSSQDQTLSDHAATLSSLLSRMGSVEGRVSVLEAGTTHVVTGTTRLTGLKPGKRYCVSVYGLIANRSTGNAYLNSVRVTNSGGAVLARTNASNINWPDGHAPQSALLYFTAPADGVVNGYTDNGSSWNMVAFSIN